MERRADRLIATLQLMPHPEGGWFREIHRSQHMVRPDDGRGPRAALTSIHFLLAHGQFSRWHRVVSDEIWVHVEGDPLALWTWDAAAPERAPHCSLLGPLGAAPGLQPQHAVAAGLWQATTTWGGTPQAVGHALAACIVGPGFEFADFRLLAHEAGTAADLCAAHPASAAWL